MTTTTGTAEHPDVSEISDLTEGLLSPERSTEVREHLGGCPLCADVYASLEEIRGLLGSLPGPPRMPADVAARIDAALAAEALLSASAPDPSDADATNDVSRETSPADTTTADISEPTTSESAVSELSVPELSGHAHDSADTAVTPGATSATAAGATVADGPRAGRPAGRPRAATGPGRTRAARRRRGAILGTVFGTAAIGVSVLLFQNTQSSTGDSASSYETDAGSGVASDRGADSFSGTGIQDKVHALLASTPATGEPRAAESEGAGPTRNSPNVDASPKLTFQVPPCVQQGTGRTDIPLATEQGTYQGVDAFLLVLSDPTDGNLVRAYVVDASCVDRTPPAKGDLLLTQAYPRH